MLAQLFAKVDFALRTSAEKTSFSAYLFAAILDLAGVLGDKTSCMKRRSRQTCKENLA